ncbi:acyltransferase family protein [Fredinandcohnia humi]
MYEKNGVENIMKTTTRISFIDNLKIFLSLTVIAHHAGQAYGGSNGFWYVKDYWEPANLGPFFGVNSAFNMSLYFLISAYFIPFALEKKGSREFLKDRFNRLGIPLLFGFLILIPCLMYFYYINFRGYQYISFWNYYTTIYFGGGEQPTNWTGPSWPDMNFGHLWFIEHLLLYSILYLVWKLVTKKSKIRFVNFTATHLSLVSFVVIVSIITYIVRIKYPIDHWMGLLGIIQTELAHLPQYVSFVLVGLIAARNKWVQNIPRKVGVLWLLIGTVLSTLYLLGYIPGSRGGTGSRAMFYALYETTLCTGLGVGLLYLFHTKLNKGKELLRKLAENTYTVYIIHIPILVLLQYGFTYFHISGSAKFLLVFVLGTFISHLCSYYIIRRVPVFSMVFSGTSKIIKTGNHSNFNDRNRGARG